MKPLSEIRVPEPDLNKVGVHTARDIANLIRQRSEYVDHPEAGVVVAGVAFAGAVAALSEAIRDAYPNANTPAAIMALFFPLSDGVGDWTDVDAVAAFTRDVYSSDAVRDRLKKG